MLCWTRRTGTIPLTVMKPVKEKKPLAVRSFHHGRRDFLVGAFVLSCSAVVVPSLADGQSRLTATLTLSMREGGGIRFWKLPGTSGLSQTRVSNIIQDDQGFIWCGTQNGLNRFKRIIHKKSLDVLPAKRLSLFRNPVSSPDLFTPVARSMS